MSDMSFEDPEFLNSRSSSVMPERKMLAAMIARALMDLESAEPEVARSARAWLRSESQEDWSLIWALNEMDLGGQWSWIRQETERRIAITHEIWKEAEDSLAAGEGLETEGGEGGAGAGALSINTHRSASEKNSAVLRKVRRRLGRTVPGAFRDSHRVQTN